MAPRSERRRSKQPVTPGASGKDTRRLVERIGLGVALASLLSAVVFNALQVRANTHQAKLSRQTAELQLVTSLGVQFAEAREAGTESSRARILLSQRKRVTPEDPIYRPLERELDLGEYYAYIANHGYLSLPGAVRVGATICSYRRALWLLPLSEATYIARSNDLSELATFDRTHPGKLICPEPRL
jgi:hypothetical protein